MNSLQSARIETSSEDITALSQYSLTAKQVAEKICTTVKRAEEIYAHTQASKVSLDEQIEVNLPNLRARAKYNCRFCKHETISPKSITIENIHNQAKITFDEHSLHQLKEHFYFGVDQYRIDPVIASKVLGLK